MLETSSKYIFPNGGLIINIGDLPWDRIRKKSPTTNLSLLGDPQTVSSMVILATSGSTTWFDQATRSSSYQPQKQCPNNARVNFLAKTCGTTTTHLNENIFKNMISMAHPHFALGVFFMCWTSPTFSHSSLPPGSWIVLQGGPALWGIDESITTIV